MTIPGRRLLVATAASLLGAHCAADQPPPLDLATAQRLAVEHHPALRAAASAVDAASAAVDQARRLPSPELTWLREGQRPGERTTTYQLNQPLELGGKRAARVALAGEGEALADADLALARAELKANVTAAWFAALAAQERGALAAQQEALARRGTGVAERRVAAGKAAPLDATRARLAEAEARTDAARAQSDLAIARTELAALVGIAADVPLAPAGAGTLPEPAALATLRERAADGPAVRRARRVTGVRQAETDVARAARYPDLTLSLGTQRDDQLGRRQTVVGLAVPLPLFDRKGADVAAATARTRQASAEHDAARLAAVTGVETAWLRYRRARDEALLLEREVVPAAQEAAQLALKSFDYGKSGFLDALDAQRTWVQARTRLADALAAAWRAQADLERLVPNIE